MPYPDYLSPTQYAWLVKLLHGPQRYVLGRPSLESLIRRGMVEKTESGQIHLTDPGYREYRRCLARNTIRNTNKRLKRNQESD